MKCELCGEDREENRKPVSPSIAAELGADWICAPCYKEVAAIVREYEYIPVRSIKLGALHERKQGR